MVEKGKKKRCCLVQPAQQQQQPQQLLRQQQPPQCSANDIKLKHFLHNSTLQARVSLGPNGVLPVLVPVGAGGLPGGVGKVDGALALEELHTEALADVPRDVAVHEPGTRVVGLERQREPAAAGQERDVAPRRVVVRQRAGGGADVERARARA